MGVLTVMRSPKILIEPLLSSIPVASNVPEAMTVPLSDSICKLDPLNSISPSSFTVTVVAFPVSALVSNSGKDKGVKGNGSPVFVSRGDTSKFNNCPAWEMRTKFSPVTAAMVILPPTADNSPVLTTLPPSRVKF